MQLRTAKRGRNAGGQFWGCTRWPACKGTKDFTTTPQSRTQEEPTQQAESDHYPVRISAAPLHENLQVGFFMSCALPTAFVATLESEDHYRPINRSLAQWRLDFPLPKELVTSPTQASLLAVTESILTRGTIPFCSPSLEKALGFPSDSHPATESILQAARHATAVPSCRAVSFVFDSDAEHKLFLRASSLIIDQRLPWTILPQISLSSLSPLLDPNQMERGDLLFVHPDRSPILVEVDGEDHEDHQQRDARRDLALSSRGVNVIRVSAQEIRAGEGLALQSFERLLLDGRLMTSEETDLSIAFRWSKFFHQSQLAILAAIRGGWLSLGKGWKVGIVIPKILEGDPRAETLVELMVYDLYQFLTHLFGLYGSPLTIPEPQGILLDREGETDSADVLIGPADILSDFAPSSAGHFFISDVLFPNDIQAMSSAAQPLNIANPNRDDAEWFLNYIFRKESFWEGQWDTIERSLKGLDSVVLLPTGAGKSIAFQLAALLLPGRCIVVDPILSLIDDQIDNLSQVGIDRCIGITSQLSTEGRERALRDFASGQYLFCYVAPERFQTVPFRDALRTLTSNSPISLIAIDEAHCVSEWGHDFRTAYLNLGRIAREYATSQGQVPPLVALTGTASKIVLKDVQRELGITSFDAIITPKTFDRPELRYTVLTCASSEKFPRVLGFLNRLPSDFGVSSAQFFMPLGSNTKAGLVFCPHVNGPFGVAQQADQLARALGAKVEMYSGGSPKGFDASNWDSHKREVAHEFKRNRSTILACTKAFGMGIDKPNIRYTVHLGLPASIEAFYQEAGRAGRDRQPAQCAIILSNDYPERSGRVLTTTSFEEVERINEETTRSDEDDVMRALWFHLRAFRGQESELADIQIMLSLLGNVLLPRQLNISWKTGWPTSTSAKEHAEKALHRLVVLGVVQDYTVNYASEEFCVRISGAAKEDIARSFGQYAGAYQRTYGQQKLQQVRDLNCASHEELVLTVAKSLVGFIYEHIEQQRRRALYQILLAVNLATGEHLRRRILEYLQQSEWDEQLETMRDSLLGGLDGLSPILDNVVSPNDASSLRGAVDRMLSSYPDIPGLLLLRSLAEMMCSDADFKVAKDNLDAALGFATEKFSLHPAVIAAGIGHAIMRASDKDSAAETVLLSTLESKYVGRDVVRALLKHIPERLAFLPAIWLNRHLAAHCATLRSKGE